MSGAPHHQPTLEISVWLDREAMRYERKDGKDAERSARLREAATLIRTQRAELVKARMTRAVRSSNG